MKETRAQQYAGYTAQQVSVSVDSAQYKALEHNATVRLKKLQRSVARLKRLVWYMAQQRTYHA